MTGVQILTSLIEILVGGLVSMSRGIADGIIAMITNLFFVSADGAITGLSVFGILVAVFAGISLAVALTRLTYRWLISLGARNR